MRRANLLCLCMLLCAACPLPGRGSDGGSPKEGGADGGGPKDGGSDGGGPKDGGSDGGLYLCPEARAQAAALPLDTWLFDSDRSGNHEIYSMHADGTEVTQLTHDGAY